MVNDLYVGCVVELYVGASPTDVISTHTITSNTDNDIILSPDPRTIIANDFIHIRGYGAPCVGAKIHQLKDSMPITG